MPLLDGPTDPLFLNGVQVWQLVQEVQFTGQLVDDQLLEREVRALIALSALPSQDASQGMVGIEFPRQPAITWVEARCTRATAMEPGSQRPKRWIRSTTLQP